CLHRLFGMFVFAIWDARTQELFLARDRMGIKPLYYTTQGPWGTQGNASLSPRHVLFASELRALLASGMVPRTIDRDALVDHLRYQTVHAPATLVRGVRMLQAGHWMVLNATGLREERWYDLPGSVISSAAHMTLPSIHK